MNSYDKETMFHSLATDIIDNQYFSLLASQAHSLVMGEGSLDANIVIIGEAPGRKEDQEGRPFVGASGKLLNELLDSVGISRSQVYITNIVKYRPPENRDPSTIEKDRFWPYLVRQLEIIDPQIIVTLGRHAMNQVMAK